MDDFSVAPEVLFYLYLLTSIKKGNLFSLNIIKQQPQNNLLLMSSFFKSKDYHKAHSQLQNTGFFNSDFINFHIKGIADQIIKDPSLFAPLAEVLEDVKLTPLRVLKVQLMIQHMLQVSSNMHENDHLFRLLLKIGLKVKKMIDSEASFTIQQYTEPDQNICSSKYLVDRTGAVCENGTSLILRKIVEPLLELQKRLIYSYDLINPSFNTPELELSECWAVLNLLKKFVQISPQIEAIGRYYSKKYAAAMIYLIKVLNVDIQLLYQRIKKFVSGKVIQYKEFMKQGLLKIISDQQRTRINQFLQLIEEIEAVNESIKLLYLSASFKVDLACNQISMPVLFTVEPHLDLLYLLKKAISRDEDKIWNTICKRTKINHCKSMKTIY